MFCSNKFHCLCINLALKLSKYFILNYKAIHCKQSIIFFNISWYLFLKIVSKKGAKTFDMCILKHQYKCEQKHKFEGFM